MNNWLTFGWVGCPHCSCQNPLTVSWRFFKFKRTKCRCCQKVFWFQREDFHEDTVFATST